MAFISVLSQQLKEVTLLSTLVRLLMAVLFGGLIGMERGRKRRPAGLRTHMLVCLGSALVMITNQYIVEQYGTADPSRLGAQVVSGIGFLGAGTIIVTRQHQVKGLTTAAGLWASACMGLAIGIGFYEGAIVACGFIAVIMITMNKLDNKIVARSRTMEVYASFTSTQDISGFLGFVTRNGMKVTYLEIVHAKNTGAEMGQGGIAALVTLRLPKKHDHYEVLQNLHNAPGVSFIEEI